MIPSDERLITLLSDGIFNSLHCAWLNPSCTAVYPSVLVSSQRATWWFISLQDSLCGLSIICYPCFLNTIQTDSISVLFFIMWDRHQYPSSINQNKLLTKQYWKLPGLDLHLIVFYTKKWGGFAWSQLRQGTSWNKQARVTRSITLSEIISVTNLCKQAVGYKQISWQTQLTGYAALMLDLWSA